MGSVAQTLVAQARVAVEVGQAAAELVKVVVGPATQAGAVWVGEGMVAAGLVVEGMVVVATVAAVRE